jgi:dethiobiotin synthetase
MLSISPAASPNLPNLQAEGGVFNVAHAQVQAVRETRVNPHSVVLLNITGGGRKKREQIAPLVQQLAEKVLAADERRWTRIENKKLSVLIRVYRRPEMGFVASC